MCLVCDHGLDFVGELCENQQLVWCTVSDGFFL